MKVLFAGDISFDWLPKAGILKLLPYLAGKIAFGREYDFDGTESSTFTGLSGRWRRAGLEYQSERIASGLRSALSGADFVCANLECPLTSVGTPIRDKKYTLRAGPQFIRVLKDLGITHVNLANNHILDFGPEALEDTCRNLDAAGIPYTGLIRSGERQEPVILDDGRTRLASLNYVEPSIIDPSPESFFKYDRHPCPLDPETVIEDVRRCATIGVVVVVFHWGVEWSFLETDKQRFLARAVIDAGAAAVIGHHTHMAGGIEEYNGGLIVHSLGNLYMSLPPFTASRAENRLMAQLEFDDKGLKTYSLIPLSNGEGGYPVISEKVKVVSLVGCASASSMDSSFDSYSTLSSANVSTGDFPEMTAAVWSDEYLLRQELPLYRLPLAPGWRATNGKWSGTCLAREFFDGEFFLVNLSHLQGRETVSTRFTLDSRVEKLQVRVGYPESMRLHRFCSRPMFEMFVNGESIHSLSGDRSAENWVSAEIPCNQVVSEIEIRVSGTSDDYGLLCWRVLGT